MPLMKGGAGVGMGQEQGWGERVCFGTEGCVHTGIQMVGDKDCD